MLAHKSDNCRHKFRDAIHGHKGRDRHTGRIAGDHPAQLSTSRRGVCIIARSDTSADLKIERRDSAHYFINVPASATVDMDEGEIVLTIELRDTLTDAVLKAERRTIPLIKAREIRP